jgi:hypothetical protein
MKRRLCEDTVRRWLSATRKKAFTIKIIGQHLNLGLSSLQNQTASNTTQFMVFVWQLKTTKTENEV